MEYNKKRTTVKTTVVRRVKRQGSLHFQEKPDDNRVSCPLSFHINYKVNGQLQLTEVVVAFVLKVVQLLLFLSQRSSLF